MCTMTDTGVRAYPSIYWPGTYLVCKSRHGGVLYISIPTPSQYGELFRHLKKAYKPYYILRVRGRAKRETRGGL